MSIFKPTNRCLIRLDSVCTHAIYTPTQQTYSLVHLAIQFELPLGFTRVVLNLHHLCETLPFPQNNKDTVRMSFIGANTFISACTLLWTFFDILKYTFCPHLLLSKAMCVYVFVYTSSTCLSPFTKGIVNYFLKSFQYRQITLHHGLFTDTVALPASKISD